MKRRNKDQIVFFSLMKELLEDSTVIKIGVGLDSDMTLLSKQNIDM